MHGPGGTRPLHGTLASMQAVRVHDGGVLVHETVPDPVPGEGEVLVELRTAALNRRDSLVARGVYPFPLPLIPGSDGAGIRRDTGQEVVVYSALRWHPGDAYPGDDYEILGGPRDGTYAELVSLPAANLFPKPTRLSWEEAAAFPLAALTAYRALFTRARLQPRETVLVLGAGSGVSTFAIQLATQAAARVLVTSSSDEKIERAREIGADAGVNYATTPDWPAAVQDLGGADVVLDAVGSTWQQSLECVRGKGGRVVVFGATGGTDVALQVRPFYFSQHALLGTMMGSPDDFAGLMRMIEQGAWRPVIDSVRPLADAPAALERMISGAQFGKLVLIENGVTRIEIAEAHYFLLPLSALLLSHGGRLTGERQGKINSRKPNVLPRIHFKIERKRLRRVRLNNLRLEFHEDRVLAKNRVFVHRLEIDRDKKRPGHF